MEIIITFPWNPWKEEVRNEKLHQCLIFQDNKMVTNLCWWKVQISCQIFLFFICNTNWTLGSKPFSSPPQRQGDPVVLGIYTFKVARLLYSWSGSKDLNYVSIYIHQVTLHSISLWAGYLKFLWIYALFFLCISLIIMLIIRT